MRVFLIFARLSLAFLYMEGYFPENFVDHKNRIRDDNRWKNLRHVSHLCNMRNQSVAKNNVSGVTGVIWNSQRKRWRGSITIMNKNEFLGHFMTMKEAVRARWDAEVKYGFPNCNTTSSAYVFLQGEYVWVNFFESGGCDD